jgi:preprotein translocase subunit SecG
MLPKNINRNTTRNPLTRCTIFVFFTFKFTALFLCKGATRAQRVAYKLTKKGVFKKKDSGEEHHGPESEFTAKITAETVPTADSTDETAAGTYGQPGNPDQRRAGGKPRS